jgi:chromosome segregation ATPase
VDETGVQIRAASEEAEGYRAKISEIKRSMGHHDNTVKDLRKRLDTILFRIKKLQDYINEVQEKAMRDTQYCPTFFQLSLPQPTHL